MFIYNAGVLISAWYFTENDNFKMEFDNEYEYSEMEMETGLLRQQKFGWRLHINFTLEALDNRRLMEFLRKACHADQIIIEPHQGGMRNPQDNSYRFEMLWDGNFTPQYLLGMGRWIGHTLSFALKSKDLFAEPPLDGGQITLVERSMKTIAGVTAADPQYSVTYWGEKMFYGGWEVAGQDEMKTLAYFESAPEGETDPRGDPSIRAAGY